MVRVAVKQELGPWPAQRNQVRARSLHPVVRFPIFAALSKQVRTVSVNCRNSSACGKRVLLSWHVADAASHPHTSPAAHSGHSDRAHAKKTCYFLLSY